MDALRLAIPADAEAIDALMKASITAIFPTTYDARQTASAIIHVASVDRMLLADGTYFVIEENGDLVACGGWSRRHRMYTGSGASEDDDRLLDPAKDPAHIRAMFVRSDRTRRGLGTRILEACVAAARLEGFRMLALKATLPGLLLYRYFGFQIIEETTITTPDGTVLECVDMEMPIPPA